MVTIIQQPRLSFGKFRQIYRFDLPPNCSNPLQKVSDFFHTRRVRNLIRTPDGVRFSRGNRLRALFSVNELWLQQNVVIKIVPADSRQSLLCDYECRSPLFCTLRFGQSNLYFEVQRLQAFVNGSFVQPAAKNTLFRRFVVRPIFKSFFLLFRLASWSHYNGGRRLTPAGILAVSALVAAAAMGVDTDSTVTYQAFTPLFFLLSLAVVFSWFFRGQFSAVRILPRFGTVGLPFSYVVQVKNLSGNVQSGLTLLENLADPRPSFDEWLAAQLADERRVRSFKFNQRTNRAFQRATVRESALPPLIPGGEIETRVSLVPLRRGVIRFTGVTFARPDPLGLFRSFIKAPAPQTVLVLPKRYPLARVALPGTEKYQEGGVAMAANVGRSDEFVSLREYRRGDPVRHIHWRSWAKTGKPIVKEFEDDYFTRHALVLDTFTDDPRSAVFEEAVSVAASFACTIPTQESLLDLLFVGPQAYSFTSGRGLAHADQMLEILASVRAISGQPFAPLEQLVVDHSPLVTGCVFVLLSWDEARKELVRKLKQLAVPVMVIVVVEADGDTKLAPGPMQDELGKFHVLEAGRIEQGLGRL
jgi:uncharacterized protein (DUF58 family)